MGRTTKKRAEQKRDLAHECSVAAKEMHESHYWPSLVDEDELVARHDIAALLCEADELVAILTASAKTAKTRQAWARGSSRGQDAQSNPGSDCSVHRQSDS